MVTDTMHATQITQWTVMIQMRQLTLVSMLMQTDSTMCVDCDETNAGREQVQKKFGTMVSTKTVTAGPTTIWTWTALKQ